MPPNFNEALKLSGAFERAQHGRAGADMIGQGRDVEVDAFAC
jgi:hypothetical protein